MRHRLEPVLSPSSPGRRSFNGNKAWGGGLYWSGSTRLGWDSPAVEEVAPPVLYREANGERPDSERHAYHTMKYKYKYKPSLSSLWTSSSSCPPPPLSLWPRLSTAVPVKEEGFIFRWTCLMNDLACRQSWASLNESTEVNACCCSTLTPLLTLQTGTQTKFG